MKKILSYKLTVKEFYEYFIIINSAINYNLITDELKYLIALRDASIINIDTNEEEKLVSNIKLILDKKLIPLAKKELKNKKIVLNQYITEIRQLQKNIHGITPNLFSNYCATLSLIELAKINEIDLIECANNLLNANVNLYGATPKEIDLYNKQKYALPKFIKEKKEQKNSKIK